jgi:hypothetical protein
MLKYLVLYKNQMVDKREEYLQSKDTSNKR